jgi:hypothetical protein
MPPIRLSVAALMAIAIPTFGGFAFLISNGGLPGSTAHAQSMSQDARSKIKDAQTKREPPARRRAPPITASARASTPSTSA